jgi:DNA-binding LacI/PurR family transcriptional regulator
MTVVGPGVAVVEQATTTNKPLRRPVMADVARLAGVSHQTVSRVINGASSIRPETRDRVVEAIERLGYRPNTAARALVTKRSATIGVISTAAGLWGPSTIQRTIEQAARGAGYFVSSVNLGDVTRRSLAAAVDHLLGQWVEGIIMVVAQDEALQVVQSEQARVPYVIVGGDPASALAAVGVDQHRGARLATRHLLDLGHTEIAHVCGPPDWAEARARLDGWERELRSAGLRPDEPISGDWTAASGYAAGRQLATRRDVTAVFAANDSTALGLLRAFAEVGRKVPDEISVVGFDDIPEAEYLFPPLTTVRQDFAGVGRRAIDVLHAAITGGEADLPRMVDAQLVVRASTSHAPS